VTRQRIVYDAMFDAELEALVAGQELAP